jgi:hypothetical protein
LTVGLLNFHYMPMKGITLGRLRPWLVRWLVSVMLLPLLMGVLPQPGLSAAAALESDLAASRCANDAGTPSPVHQQGHGAPCVLCAAGCAVCAPALTDDRFAILPFRPAARDARSAEEQDGRNLFRLLRDGTPPRGPPLS